MNKDLEITPEALQAIFEDGGDTQLAVNSWQNGTYKRFDGYYAGTVTEDPSGDSFLLQSGGEEWTVLFSEIVRTY